MYISPYGGCHRRLPGIVECAVYSQGQSHLILSMRESPPGVISILDSQYETLVILGFHEGQVVGELCWSEWRVPWCQCATTRHMRWSGTRAVVYGADEIYDNLNRQ